MARVGVFSIGIASILYLDKVLGADVKWLPPGIRNLFRCDAIAGWGMKPSSSKARAFAKDNGLNYIALEDGFLRSLGLGVHGNLEHSFVVDPVGIYYDATRPSLVETLIYSAPDSTEAKIRASNAINLIREYRLSKYNAAPEGIVPRRKKGPAVLVVDQTFGDISVKLGAGSPEIFIHMLEQAVKDHPHSEILVKVHPDVIAGKKKGYLLEIAKQKNCTLLSADLNPWSVFDIVSDVYVVTSHLGFEALLAGKTVHCFGIPYYAGWGLTIDRQKCQRRSIARTMEQVFYAVYIQYCRYLNPYTGERCELEDTIELLALQKRHAEFFRGDWQVSGAFYANRLAVKKYLGIGSNVKFIKKDKEHSLKQQATNAYQSGIELCCESKVYQWSQGCSLFEIVESSRYRPISFYAYDKHKTAYFDELLNISSFTDSELNQAALLATTVMKLVSDSPINQANSCLINKSSVIVLAKSSSCEKLHLMLSVARQENPEAPILLCIKESDLFANTGCFIKKNRVDVTYDAELDPLALQAVMSKASKLYTVNSASAYYALLLGVKVITFGPSVFSGWGLTDDRVETPNRHKQLTLNELIAGVFIRSTYYVDPESGEVVDLKTALTLLSGRSAYPYGLGFWERLKRTIRLVFLLT